MMTETITKSDEETSIDDTDNTDNNDNGTTTPVGKVSPSPTPEIYNRQPHDRPGDSSTSPFAPPDTRSFVPTVQIVCCIRP
jgi:hypothetical protein